MALPWKRLAKGLRLGIRSLIQKNGSLRAELSKLRKDHAAILSRLASAESALESATASDLVRALQEVCHLQQALDGQRRQGAGLAAKSKHQRGLLRRALLATGENSRQGARRAHMQECPFQEGSICECWVRNARSEIGWPPHPPQSN